MHPVLANPVHPTRPTISRLISDICYIERWFLIICIKQVFHIHISAILYNVIWKRSIQYISNELNIIIWTPCRYQHYQHFIIFFQSDPTFGSSGASLAKLCHRANCGFPRIAPAWSTMFFNQSTIQVDEKKKNLHERHSLIREVVCHIPLSRTLHIPTGDNLSKLLLLSQFSKNVFFYASPLRKWDSTYHWLSAAYANPGELAMYCE